MDNQFLIWIFVGLVALFVGIVVLKKGFDRLDTWQKSNPFKFAFLLACMFFILIAIWVFNNQDVVECWPTHKMQCLFPGRR